MLKKQAKYRILFLMIGFLLLQPAYSQFKFGWGFLGYSRVLNSDASENLATNGWNGYLEFAGLIANHFEPGVRVGSNIFVKVKGANSNNFSYSAGVLFNLSIMPYLRYYFLEIPAIRPYVIGGMGYSWNGFAGGKFKNGDGVEYNMSIYSGNSFAARIGGGVRLVKFLDLSLNYYYAGKLDADVKISNIPLKNRYHLHLLEMQLALTFGGNLKK